MNNIKKWITAHTAYDEFEVPRSWLRDNAEAGNIRRRVIHGMTADGEERHRILYNTADIERLIDASPDGFFDD